MTLIVCPAEGWDSLVDLVYAAQYMDDFGYAWPADEIQQERALRKATQYIIARYRPKHDYYLDLEVAANIKKACCEAAWRAAKGDLFKDSDGRLMTEQTVDVITTKWDVGAASSQITYSVIDSLMRGYGEGDGVGMVKLVRG